MPRLVLDKANDDTSDLRIEEAIENLKEDDVFVRPPRTAQASHRIVRIHPAGWR